MKVLIKETGEITESKTGPFIVKSVNVGISIKIDSVLDSSEIKEVYLKGPSGLDDGGEYYTVAGKFYKTEDLIIGTENIRDYKIENIYQEEIDLPSYEDLQGVKEEIVSLSILIERE